MRTLVLNAGYEPLAVISFRRALVLVMNQKASVVAADTMHPVTGAAVSFDRPSVIILTRYVRIPQSRLIPVSRRGVLRRDANRCLLSELSERVRGAFLFLCAAPSSLVVAA